VTVIYVKTNKRVLIVEICEKDEQRGARRNRRAEGYGQAFGEKCICAEAMNACSACAGDYEDPDRTARTPDEGDDGDGENAGEPAAEEFPARE